MPAKDPGEWDLLGRISSASNAVYLLERAGVRFVYKPESGERPLWDFPQGGLGRREVATYLVARAIGWDVIPETRFGDDLPLGPGMVQRWIEGSAGVGFTLVDPDNLAASEQDGYLSVVEVSDGQGGDWILCHLDDLALRRVAILDAVVNNTDRKVGHLIGDESGRIWAIDHGLTFHVEPKLRTALWGFAEQPLGVLGEELGACLADLAALDLPGISEAEQQAMVHRAEVILASGVFPAPSGEWPALPWPIV